MLPTDLTDLIFSGDEFTPEWSSEDIEEFENALSELFGWITDEE